FPNRLWILYSSHPASEYKFGDLLLANLASAQVISKIGSAAVGSFVSGYCPKPSDRLLNDREVRHQDTAKPGVNRLDDSINKPVIVDMRYPHNRDAFVRILPIQPNALGVMQEIRMAHRHALRAGCRPRGVLEKRQGC